MRHAPYSMFSDSVSRVGGPEAASVSRAARLATGVMWLLGLPGRVVAIRRDMALLGQMSAGQLADIGLSRQDLWDAASLPIGHEPGALFTRRAAERRRASTRRQD